LTPASEWQQQAVAELFAAVLGCSDSSEFRVWLCGRHCVARLMFKGKTLEEYKDIIDQTGLSPDDFVSGLTYVGIKK
jgi:hypothetical protein